jgi:hypothetical protein
VSPAIRCGIVGGRGWLRGFILVMLAVAIQLLAVVHRAEEMVCFLRRSPEAVRPINRQCITSCGEHAVQAAVFSTLTMPLPVLVHMPHTASACVWELKCDQQSSPPPDVLRSPPLTADRAAITCYYTSGFPLQGVYTFFGWV